MFCLIAAGNSYVDETQAAVQTGTADPLVETPTGTNSVLQQVQYGYSKVLYTGLNIHCTLSAGSRKAAVSSVAAINVVGAGAGEGGNGFVPGQSTRLTHCRQAQGAGTLSLVL